MKNRKLTCFTNGIKLLRTLFISILFISNFGNVLLAQTNDLLIDSTHFEYLGAFKVPHVSGNGGYAYGGTCITYNPANNSLFLTGHSYTQYVGEISIPNIIIGETIDDLETATFMQGDKLYDITDGNIANLGENNESLSTGDGTVLMGGLLVHNNKLIGNSYVYYDAGMHAARSHFTNSLNITETGNFAGIFKVGDKNPGYVAGYMAHIPGAWQSAFGGSALTGQHGLSITSRTSLGPGLFAFDPSKLGVDSPVAVKPLVYYPIDHPTLGVWDNETEANPQYNMTTKSGGVFFPTKTNSVIFIGTTGTGIPGYGVGTDDITLDGTPVEGYDEDYVYDPASLHKGTHAFPYVNYVWAYDASEMAEVAAGTKNPWDIVPYDQWALNIPLTPDTVRPLLGGVAYDSVTQRIFIAQRSVDGESPIIGVYKINIDDSCDLTYEQTLGNSWHFVGQSQYVNTYRGLYWVGQTKTICSVDMNLNYTGNISAINYNVTVWEVDIDNNLELTTLLATSEPVSGSLVQSGGSWVHFEFPNPILVTSGKCVILVSRVDKDNYSVTNMLRISNNYDMNDEQNDQFNVHYSNTSLAGRSAGDEDQPEPFAFDVKLYGENTTVNASTEYPAAPLNPTANAVSSEQINLSWDDFNVAVEVDHYNIYAYNMSNANLTFINNSTSKNFNVTGLTADTEYNFVITTVSSVGNESYHTNIATATTSSAGGTDTEAPTVPQNLSASAVSASQINLSWDASTDNVAVAGYRIFRGSTLIDTAYTNAFNDTGLSADTEYTYTVSAYDAANNESAQSSSASATTTATLDTEAPTVPQNLSASAVSNTQIDLTWDASTDNVAVAGYKIFRDGILIDTAYTNAFNDTGLSADTEYTYTVSAYDAANNESAQSTSVSATTTATPDTQAPSVPQNLSASAVSNTQIDLTWDASTDNVAVSGYKIFRAGILIDTAYTNSFSNTGLSSETEYTYTVSAYDAANNESAQSTSVSGITLPVDIGFAQATEFNIYPNPVTTEMYISFYLSQSSNCTIDIYNMKGEQVRQLFSGTIKTGIYETKWDITNDLGNKVSSGIYILSIQTEKNSRTDKIVVNGK